MQTAYEYSHERYCFIYNHSKAPTMSKLSILVRKKKYNKLQNLYGGLKARHVSYGRIHRE